MKPSTGLLFLLVVLLALCAMMSSALRHDICLLPMDPGPCYASMTRYYYNPASRKCEEFIYGGCKGNENNFETLKECQKTCGDICHLPMDPGPCYGYMPRYYYNPASKKCEEFIYGGCKGNENNFETLKECLNTCGDICHLPMDPGPCLALIPRYYYNLASKKCEEFTYGGCKGNGNNFETLKECQKTCGEKPGICPTPPKGTITICPVRCESDWECPGKQKCCSYGCLVDCMDPIKAV